MQGLQISRGCATEENAKLEATLAESAAENAEIKIRSELAFHAWFSCPGVPAPQEIIYYAVPPREPVPMRSNSARIASRDAGFRSASKSRRRRSEKERAPSATQPLFGAQLHFCSAGANSSSAASWVSRSFVRSYTPHPQGYRWFESIPLQRRVQQTRHHELSTASRAPGHREAGAPLFPRNPKSLSIISLRLGLWRQKAAGSTAGSYWSTRSLWTRPS
jgi:hypothetical protein